jgi:hypothetical protein
LSDFFFEDRIHQGLEGGGGISETEKHYGWFEESFVGDERRLPLISVFDPDVIVSPTYIHLGEVFSALEFV